MQLMYLQKKWRENNYFGSLSLQEVLICSLTLGVSMSWVSLGLVSTCHPTDSFLGWELSDFLLMSAEADNTPFKCVIGFWLRLFGGEGDEQQWVERASDKR